MYLKESRDGERSTSEAIIEETRDKRSFGLTWRRWRLNLKKNERLKDVLEIISREFDDELNVIVEKEILCRSRPPFSGMSN